jgi:hypothetical protein
MGIFKVGFYELFAWAGFKLQSSCSLTYNKSPQSNISISAPFWKQGSSLPMEKRREKKMGKSFPHALR